ncbi:ComEC/Rec2 family competence protein, partial [Microbacterium sp.]|uniref:ComEC/Rec2 family competence protein n=1 Tax=Microbacterium sp. TaxID=51671 RepID=UPI003A867F65
LACAVGAAAAAGVAVAAPDRAAVADRLASGPVAEEVTVAGKVERYGRSWSFDARLRDPAATPILVVLPDPPARLDVGAIAEVAGSARAAEAGRREVAVVEVHSTRVRQPPTGVLAAAADLRAGLAAVTRDLAQPGAGLIAGLAVGDTGGVEPNLEERMRTASLSHLTAVSGANCALVVGLAFGLSALAGARRGVRVVCALAALAGFTVLVTPEPSVVRAAAMAAIAMLGVLLGRVGAGLALLCTAVIIALLLDPWLSLSLGFALSVVATAALLVVADPLADGLGRYLPGPLALGVSVPLAAQLACAPLLVLITPVVSAYGVLANLLAASAAPAATVLGLAACLGAGIPVLGPGLAAVAWLPAAWIAATAQVFADLPGALLPWPAGLAGVAGLAVAGAAVVAVVVGRARRLAFAVLGAIVAALIVVGPVAAWWDRAGVPERWSVAMCSVGQGDAVLIASAGQVALIDTGPDPDVLARCLTRFGVDRVDLLILTHFDRDHSGGVAAVRGAVGALLHGPVDDAHAAAVVDDLTAGGARPVPTVEGASGALGDARWRVLWPSADTETGGNDASVVVEVTGGGVPSAVFLGDLSAAPQQRLRASLAGPVEVVKVAHHGSGDQDPGLYAALAPAVALISVGENDYGHPRAETLDVLAGVGATIARTDRDGDIAVWRDGDSLRIWRSPPSVVVPGG